MTKDAALADDLQDPTTGSPATNPFAFQNIGRFIPCSLTTTVSNTAPPIPSGGDYTNPYLLGQSTTGYRYHFATCLFEYFSALQNPNQDYTPNVSIDMDYNISGYSDAVCANAYPGVGAYSTNNTATGNYTSPVAVPNTNGTSNINGSSFSNGQTGYAKTAGSADPLMIRAINANAHAFPSDWYDAETTVGSDGWINVNTASWKVLACVPLVPLMNSDNTNNNGKTDWVNTQNLAKAIVYFRDIDDGSVVGSKHPHGPFHNLWELNLVPGFATAAIPPGNGKFPPLPWSAGNYPPNATCGDYFSDPARSGATAYPLNNNMANMYRTVDDWEYTSLMVNRVSNLLTVRSDTFTAYMQVQAWQNVGTPAAQMVAQRRAAYIFDRSSTAGLNNGVMNLLKSQSTTGQIWYPMSTNPTLRVYNVPTN